VDAWSLVLQIATLIAVAVAAWQLMFQSRQMHRDFETLYVARYWALMDRRSLPFVLTGAPRKSDRGVIDQYLQLCEDEIDCRRIGRVTDSTWRFWRAAIVDQVSERSYRRFLDSLPDDRFPRLRTLLREPAGYDPLGWGWLRRRMHGL
jgi:hypothetical protein